MPKEPYKQGFENVCHEYVTMLNQMPDDNLTECSRYVNVDDSEFEYVVRENLPEKLKIHEQIFKNVTSHSIMYKHKNLSDDYEILWFYDEDKNNRFMCKYIFIDFSIVMQNKVSDCYKIENYKSKYPNKRMK
jgi:hypothetical protein